MTNLFNEQIVRRHSRRRFLKSLEDHWYVKRGFVFKGLFSVPGCNTDRTEASSANVTLANIAELGCVYISKQRIMKWGMLLRPLQG